MTQQPTGYEPGIVLLSRFPRLLDRGGWAAHLSDTVARLASRVFPASHRSVAFSPRSRFVPASTTNPCHIQPRSDARCTPNVASPISKSFPVLDVPTKSPTGGQSRGELGPQPSRLDTHLGAWFYRHVSPTIVTSEVALGRVCACKERVPRWLKPGSWTNGSRIAYSRIVIVETDAPRDAASLAEPTESTMVVNRGSSLALKSSSSVRIKSNLFFPRDSVHHPTD